MSKHGEQDMSYRDVNYNKIGLAHNPEPPDPGPSEEERIEYKYSQIRDSEWHIDRCFEGDEKLVAHLARLLAHYREHPGGDLRPIVDALNEWLDSELWEYAKIIVSERNKRGDYDF
jgi:hypothetical protein